MGPPWRARAAADGLRSRLASRERAGWLEALCAIACATAGCAQGVDDAELPPRTPSSPPVELAAAGNGAAAGTTVIAGTGAGTGNNAGAGAQGGSVAASYTEACARGETQPCSCEDGGQGGQRRCLYDADSPLDGFLSACEHCTAPEPAASDAGADATIATTLPTADAGSVDAGTPDSGGAVDPCADGQKNGFESDTDCGGPECGPCAVGDSCVDASDCGVGAICEDSVCGLPPAVSNVTRSNYDHPSYTYARTIDWSCAGTTTFDSSGSGSFVTTSSCSDTSDEQPEFACNVAQTSGGPAVCLLRAAGFMLGTDHTLRLIGTRPVILAVEGNATLAGTIDASAEGSTPGAGGNVDCVQASGANGSGDTARFAGASGGGGGGFGTAGGSGGTANTDGGNVAGGSGGSTRGTATLSPLLGGCGGGRAGDCTSAGGAGGGALQVSASDTLTVTGTLRAKGGDGALSCGQSDEGGGSGGGSGGGILLEGATVDTSTATFELDGGDGGSNGAYAGIFPCGSSPGGAGSTSTSQPGADGRSCQGGSSGGGGGYGRVVD